MARRRKIVLAVGITAMMVLITSWYGISHYYLFNATLPAPLKSGTVYLDPDNYFTINMPDGWNVTREVHDVFPSDQQGQYHLTTIRTTLMPNETLGSDDPFVSIYLESSRDAGSKHWICTAQPINPDTTLAGLPADHHIPGEWMVNSQEAHFQIDFRIAKGQLGRLQVVPTPRPAAGVKSRTDLLTSIIATFIPIPDKPLSC